MKLNPFLAAALARNERQLEAFGTPGVKDAYAAGAHQPFVMVDGRAVALGQFARVGGESVVFVTARAWFVITKPCPASSPPSPTFPRIGRQAAARRP